MTISLDRRKFLMGSTALAAAGIDGLFTDFPGEAVQVLR